MHNFGPLSAQSDPDILSYFHTTGQVSKLLTEEAIPSDFIFVARPGGGKTALVRWLQTSSHGRTVVLISPEDTRIVMDDDTPNVEDNRMLMRGELFTGTILEIMSRCSLPPKLEAQCREYSKKWWQLVGSFINRNLGGLSLLGSGFSLKPNDRQDYLAEIRKGQKVTEAMDLLRQLTTKVNLTLVVDNPEYIVGKGLEDVTKANATRIGAFLSVLGQLHALGVQVVVFVKEHILQDVQDRYRDSMDFEDRVESLEWTEQDLMQMLILRIERRLNKDWEDVFTISGDEFRTTVVPCLINGPRDLLFVCNTAGRGGSKISKSDLKKGVDTLRSQKLRDVSTQYGERWPRIDAFVNATIALLAKEFGRKPVERERFLSAIEKEFQDPNSELADLRGKEPWIYTALWASPRIHERLFLIGCIGYILKGQRYYPWAGRSLDKLRLASSYFVSPLFISRQ